MTRIYWKAQLNIAFPDMKAALILVCCAVGALSACEYHHGNGRPACNGEEMGRLWRNNWDPTRFWSCVTLNTLATAVKCEVGLGFSETAQRCIEWSAWEWTPPCDPPSGGVVVVRPIGECEYNHGDGRPACIAEEVDRLWRNNWDPTRLWTCSSVGAVAQELICETGTGFSEVAQKCVDWNDWEWTTPCNPPSVS